MELALGQPLGRAETVPRSAPTRTRSPTKRVHAALPPKPTLGFPAATIRLAVRHTLPSIQQPSSTSLTQPTRAFPEGDQIITPGVGFRADISAPPTLCAHRVPKASNRATKGCLSGLLPDRAFRSGGWPSTVNPTDPGDRPLLLAISSVRLPRRNPLLALLRCVTESPATLAAAPALPRGDVAEPVCPLSDRPRAWPPDRHRMMSKQHPSAPRLRQLQEDARRVLQRILANRRAVPAIPNRGRRRRAGGSTTGERGELLALPSEPIGPKKLNLPE